MKKIAIIQRYIPQYRKVFFDQLQCALSQKNIELILLYGQPSKKDELRKDAISLDWAIHFSNSIFRIGKTELYWQPVTSFLKDVDLIIVEQASKLLLNYLLLIQNALGYRKMAFWGHGINFQETTANRLGEWIKRQVSTHVFWWFAYNELSARIVHNMGFPLTRITNTQNAIDTRSLNKAYQLLTQADIEKKRLEMNLTSKQVGLFVGGMYPAKQIPFLLESIRIIRLQIPDFEMIFIGSGIDAELVENASKTYEWVHYVGPKFDDDKVAYFKFAKLLLNPFLSGLNILDSFALETPLVTCNKPGHGPEICYLENGINGIIIDGDCNPQEYANRVVSLLKNEEQYNSLVESCKKSYEKYTIENMVEKFASGIEQALAEM